MAGEGGTVDGWGTMFRCGHGHTAESSVVTDTATLGSRDNKHRDDSEEIFVAGGPQQLFICDTELLPVAARTHANAAATALITARGLHDRVITFRVHRLSRRPFMPHPRIHTARRRGARDRTQRLRREYDGRTIHPYASRTLYYYLTLEFIYLRVPQTSASAGRLSVRRFPRRLDRNHRLSSNCATSPLRRSPRSGSP